MNKTEKSALKDSLVEKFSGANALILTEYRGLTVEQLTQLRNELRPLKAEVKIAKNRIVKIAVKESEASLGFEKLAEELTGPIATVISYGDIAQIAKTLLNVGKEHDKLIVKVGVSDGDVIDTAQIKAISDLPSREELLAKIVGSIASPSRGLVTTLSGVARNLVTVLGAIRDKKES